MTRSARNGPADAPVVIRGPTPIAGAGVTPAANAEATVTSFAGHTLVRNLAGSGPPVLLLHDMGASARQWDRVRQLRARSHGIGTWDARGRGSSRGTPGSAVPTCGPLAVPVGRRNLYDTAHRGRRIAQSVPAAHATGRPPAKRTNRLRVQDRPVPA